MSVPQDTSPNTKNTKQSELVMLLKRAGQVKEMLRQVKRGRCWVIDDRSDADVTLQSMFYLICAVTSVYRE